LTDARFSLQNGKVESTVETEKNILIKRQ